MTDKELYAHSANPHGDWQPLADHLRNVADLARGFADHFGGGDLAYLAGLWHDVGKADPAWQRYLRQSAAGDRARGTGPDHKCAGALFADEAGGFTMWAGLLIQGHHGGLKHPHGDYRPWLCEKRRLPGPKRARELILDHMPDLGHHADPFQPGFGSPRDLEFFLRLVYSALVDADSLDTEAHYLGGEPSGRGNTSNLNELWQRYQTFLSGQPPVAFTSVNAIRREVHDACVRAARERPGVFRLTVPTGGGKTRSAMAFALRHGMAHELRRIIVAVPFTTITQQTARVYREIFEDGYTDAVPVVLEHHSAAAEGTGKISDDESFSPEAVWQRIAAENWDAPIVVTTTVQLFESLFSNRRAKTRKLHNLAKSVIVLDEAQALPPGLLSPILDALRQLTDNYGATVVLSTATQPAFEVINEFRDVAPREIVSESDSARHFEALRRVEYDWRTDRPREWHEIARWIRNERRALVIVNTKRHAMELLDALADPDALHLSTLLCAAHRRAVLDTINQRLASGQPCRVVSTQVVEAGVDLDFPMVFRAEGPLDAVIQAAGRCNREGRLADKGRVVVFRPPDDALPPGGYTTGRDILRHMQKPGFDPDDPATVRSYFEWLTEESTYPDEKKIQPLRDNLDFPAVADKFRMIPDDTYDVIVDYPEPGDKTIEGLVDRLRNHRGPPREMLRQLQPYTVSLYDSHATRLRKWIEPLIPGLGRWLGRYDPVRGVTEADPDYIV